MNKILYKTKAYLAGSVQSSSNQSWRDEVSQRLIKMEIIPYNPLNMPFFNKKKENPNIHLWLKEKARARELKVIRDYFIKLRRKCLRMIDLSDMIIAYIKTNAVSYGTAEELSFGERSLKQTFLVIDDMDNVPYWLLSMFEPQNFFENFDQLFDELKKLDSGEKHIDEKYMRLLKKELR